MFTGPKRGLLLESGCSKFQIKKPALSLAGYLPPCYFKEYIKEKGKAGRQFGKEELKWVLFTDNMLIYLQNHIKYTQQLLNLISKFSKITGYNVNIQKSTEYLHASNKCLSKIMCLLQHRIFRNKPNKRHLILLN